MRRTDRAALASAFRRTTVLTSLAALAAVSVGFPGWAQVLRDEGYYSDLSLALDRQHRNVPAGGSTTLSVLVNNGGPDSSGAPWVVLSADDGVTMAASNCWETVSGSLKCSVSSMESGTSWGFSADVTFDQDARGVLVVGGAVGADEVDPNPGNEVDAVWFDVRGSHRVHVSLVDTVPERMANGRLRWVFLVGNDGPSSVLSLRMDLSASPWDESTSILCQPEAGARCANEFEHAYLPADGRLWYTFEVAALAEDREHIEVFVSAMPLEGEDVGGEQQWDAATYTVGIFSASFE